MQAAAPSSQRSHSCSPFLEVALPDGAVLHLPGTRSQSSVQALWKVGVSQAAPCPAPRGPRGPPPRPQHASCPAPSWPVNLGSGNPEPLQGHLRTQQCLKLGRPAACTVSLLPWVHTSAQDQLQGHLQSSERTRPPLEAGGHCRAQSGSWRPCRLGWARWPEGQLPPDPGPWWSGGLAGHLK